MRYCEYCGKEIPDDAMLCPYCGKPVSKGPGDGNARSGNNGSSGSAAGFDAFFDTEDVTSSIDAVDIQNNTLVSVLAYLDILVLIPLIFSRDSRYARFHTNQGLVLLIFTVAAFAVRRILTALIGWIPIFGWLGAWIVNIVFGLAGIGILILAIIGIINALSGRAKRLPVIGGIDILK